MGWLIGFVVTVTLGSSYVRKFGEDFDKEVLENTFAVVIVLSLIIFVLTLLGIVL